MKKIQTEKAPKALGPYSQAIESNNFIFCSDQIAIDPKTNSIVGKTIEEQTKQVIENLKNVLEAAGSSLKKAVKVTLYLKNMDDFGKVNEIYAAYFTEKPARATVEVSRLPKDALIEIDVVAEK